MSDSTIKDAAAAEITEELQALFAMIDGAPKEADGWYTIARLYEIAMSSGSLDDGVSQDAFRFRISKLAEAGKVVSKRHGRWRYYRIDKL